MLRRLSPQRRVTRLAASLHALVVVAGLIAVGLADGDAAQLALLAACAVLANRLTVRVRDELGASSALSVYLLAAIFVGPLAGLGVVLAAEVVSWLLARERRGQTLLLDLTAAGIPVGVVGGIDLALRPAEFLGGVSATMLMLLGALAVVLSGIVAIAGAARLDHRPLASVGRDAMAVVPALALTAPLFPALAFVYAGSTIVGAVLTLAWMGKFTLLTRLAVHAQDSTERTVRLAEERTQLLHHGLRTEARERRRLAELLHDDALQGVLAARQDVRAALGGKVDRLPRAVEALDAAQRGLRAAVYDLAEIEPHGSLEAALTELARRHAETGELAADVTIEPDIATEHDELLVRTARELLVNVVKHAQATHVALRLWTDADAELVLEVQDDGVGLSTSLPAARREGHVGLALCEARVHAVEGAVEVGPGPDGGTRVRVRIPTASAAAHQGIRVVPPLATDGRWMQPVAD